MIDFGSMLRITKVMFLLNLFTIFPLLAQDDKPYYQNRGTSIDEFDSEDYRFMLGTNIISLITGEIPINMHYKLGKRCIVGGSVSYLGNGKFRTYQKYSNIISGYLANANPESGYALMLEAGIYDDFCFDDMIWSLRIKHYAFETYKYTHLTILKGVTFPILKKPALATSLKIGPGMIFPSKSNPSLLSHSSYELPFLFTIDLAIELGFLI